MIWRCTAPKKIYYSKGYCSNHSTAILSFPRFNLKAINYKRLMPCPTTSCHEPKFQGGKPGEEERGESLNFISATGDRQLQISFRKTQ